MIAFPEQLIPKTKTQVTVLLTAQTAERLNDADQKHYIQSTVSAAILCIFPPETQLEQTLLGVR